MAEFYIAYGDTQTINFGATQGLVHLDAARDLQVHYVRNDEWRELSVGEEIPAPLLYEGLLRLTPTQPGACTATLINLNAEEAALEPLEATVHAIRTELAVDTDRDGQVDYHDPARSHWVWGQGQRGAILLVNNDRDISDASPRPGEHSEWSELVVLPSGVSPFPADTALRLYATPQAAKRFTVYTQRANGRYERILGVDARNPADVITLSEAIPSDGATCFVEGHEYSGNSFEGFLTIELRLSIDDRPAASDSVVFRVAPWIMNPNTLPAKKVFACEIQRGAGNAAFMADLTRELADLSVPLHVIPPQDHLGDRWIQDEVEFGYCRGASHVLPVVNDSPRDRGLDGFPEKRLLGADFGHFQIGGSNPNSLDSFGNLEVSPPVKVGTTSYPFGRIVFGGREDGTPNPRGRQMMPELRHFFYAQKVQAPFEVFTDWLAVGHVDEIVCFVSSKNDKGFDTLVASPTRCKAVLERLVRLGHGNTVMFKGQFRGTPTSGVSAEITVRDLLSDAGFWRDNAKYQRYMDHNVAILKKELGLEDRHIIQIPIAFYHHPSYGGAVAYFPDMVNHLVIGNTSLVPKPHGPVIGGRCAFEAAFEAAVPNRRVRFIEDWYSYHEELGEVHCGTNTIREVFLNRAWWDHKPVGGFDV